MRYNKEPKKHIKAISLTVAFAIIFQLFTPTIAFANTGDDGQAENASFVPAGASNMVNLFTGDLNYSIPLLDIEGYPISLSYTGNVGMNTDASWVGLGWSCSPGFINREMRGLPDDFKNDIVKQQINLKDDERNIPEIGGFSRAGFSVPIVGISMFRTNRLGIGLINSSYNGLGIQINKSTTFSVSDYYNAWTDTEQYKYNSHSGLTYVEGNTEKENDFPLHYAFMDTRTWNNSTIYNSRSGLTHRTRGYGEGEEFSRGKLGVVEDIIKTLFGFSAGGAIAGSSFAGAATVGTIVNYAGGGINPVMGSSSNGSSVITTGTPTYTPSLSFRSFRSSESDESQMGLGAHFAVGLYVNTNTHLFKINNSPRYIGANGFLHASNSTYDSEVTPKTLYDMNRENDGMYYESMKVLPVPNATHDVYHVRGYGISADYRAFRNDVGSYSIPYIKNIGVRKADMKSTSFGGASLTKGKTSSIGLSQSGSDLWNNPGNDSPENLQFTGNIEVPEYEPYYFKNIGEKVIYNSDFYDQYGGDNAAKVKYKSSPIHDPSDLIIPNRYIGTEATLIVNNPGHSGIWSTYEKPIPDGRSVAELKNKRERRNNLFVVKNAGDPITSFFNETIDDYIPYDETSNPNGNQLFSSIGRDVYPHNHSSEIKVQNDKGGIYVYGIPTYNNYKEEVAFNATGGDEGATVPLEMIGYDLGDNSINNSNGYNHYYNSTELPKYVSAHLLTGVTSNDYIDKGVIGFSEDDHGSYTKFNYSKIVSDYGWRMPYGSNNENLANLSEGRYAYSNDQKGSYVYGRKEIWNVHSIESKNYIAEFYLSDREDAISVVGRDGGRGSSKLKKLDKIKLYAKEDRKTNGSAAIPVKTVHFEYDYSLCPGIPSNTGNVDVKGYSNQGGKLTLKKVYFTYGNSDKGKESVYEFKYADFDHDGIDNGPQDVNFSYADNSIDRWGNYNPNNVALLNSEYPFVHQNDRVASDRYAAAWRLSQVITPEGAATDIYYESDDYAYVQNERAMQMFKIIGVGNDPTTINTTNSNLYTISNGDVVNNNIVYFELQEEIDESIPSNAQKKLKDNYLKGIEDLYFKSLVKLSPNQNLEEFVEGYAKIKSYGLIGSSPYTHGYIELDSRYLNDGEDGSLTNPIAKAGWQALRTSIPRAYHEITSPLFDYMAIDAIKNDQATSDFLYKGRRLASSINLNKTWVRLRNPIKCKIGGGARVHTITVKDNWSLMGGASDVTYGKTYDYGIKRNGYEKPVSNGVAAYEPFKGREENPLRTPDFFVKENENFPNDYLYQVGPYGESHFPAATVGYSSVIVKNIPRTGVTENATGYSKHEFYTAKDFPTIAQVTEKSVERINSDPTDNDLLLGLPSIDHGFASQGFSILKNDMHGKEKATALYDEWGATILKSTTHYKKTPIVIGGHNGVLAYQLNNEATIIENNGIKSVAFIGKDIDMYNSYRETFNHDFAASKTKSRKMSLTTLFGILGKNESSSVSKSSKRLYTTAFTKVINQYGLVERIETENLGKKSTLTNLAYDGETGEVLLTSVENEFEDKLYNFRYPAHWYYDNLGQAYKNSGIHLSDLNSSIVGTIDLNSTTVNYFVKGDKLLLEGAGIATTEAWVLNVDNVLGSENITCIDKVGGLISFNLSDPTIELTIVESGRNNLQNLSIGSVVSLTNPIANSVDLSKLTFTDVLQSSSVELSDNWTMACEPDIIDQGGYIEPPYNLPSPSFGVNPFVEGVKGQWRAYKTYSYNQDRNLVGTTSTSDIRKDGPYTSFKPFWDFDNNGKLVPVYDANYPNATNDYENWKINAEITRYGKDGNLIETKDILDRHATTLYGYNPSLKNVPIAIASNAQQKQIANDGFEDYDYLADPSHVNVSGQFNFNYAVVNNIDASIVNEEAHTGNKSLKLADGSTIKVGKGIVDNCSGEPLYNPADNYLLEHCDCEQQFSPSQGKYIVGAWVKQNLLVPGSTISNVQIIVEELDANYVTSYTATLSASGPVIEGWQRIEGEIDVLNGSKGISLTLQNNGEADAYFDDIRIHPFNSAMKTMVYHPENLRLMAELDNRNYATFFEYDEEGTLVRIKKETEKGIVTIKETRSSIVKK